MSVVVTSISMVVKVVKAAMKVVHTVAPSVYTRSGMILLHFLGMKMNLSPQQLAGMTQEELAAVLYNNCCQVEGCDMETCLVASKMLRFLAGMVGEQSMTS